MAEVYVTLFDSSFLPQGLALHQSLVNLGEDFRLWVICLDQPCFHFLHDLGLPNLYLLNLLDLENDSLLRAKSSRTRAEYCWTLTPWAIQWALEADSLAERVTYLDADTFFLKSPSEIFFDFAQSGKSVLLTEHGYSPHYDQTATSGRFCVQFIPVQRGRGELVLHWWRDRCIEWCYARLENGLFGDQKYIESLSDLFSDDVYIIKGDGRFLAPWNATIFRYSDAVLYHFHGFRLFSPTKFFFTSYRVPPPLILHVYQPYASLLADLFRQYSELYILFKPQIRLTFLIRLQLFVAHVHRSIDRLISQIPYAYLRHLD